MNNSDYQSFVLQLFNLEDADVKSVEYLRAGNNAIIDITLNSNPQPCPECGFDSPKIKNYVLKKIVHSSLTDRACTLHYHARRYICPVCRKTYYEHNPFVFKSMKISIGTVRNVLEELKDYNETFASVAHRNHISPTTVASIFDSHVNIPRKALPAMINFDEVYAFKSKNSKYVCMILDYQTQAPVDVLPSRRYEYLYSYFMSIPKEERKNVHYVCSDMYDCYRSIAKACFPNAITLVDHFHVSQELNRRVDAVRIKAMKDARNRKDTDTYYLLKKFGWMIYHSEETPEQVKQLKKKGELPLFDPNRTRKMNAHFNRYLNFYDIREMLRSLDSDLKEAWNLKDEAVDFYSTASSDNAGIKLDELIAGFKDSSIDEMRQFGKTLIKWRNEIINSFFIVGYEYKINADTGLVAARPMKMNNAIIENRNSVIKCIKKNANGYTNWTRFRNRVLYVLDKNSTYSLYPLNRGKKS